MTRATIATYVACAAIAIPALTLDSVHGTLARLTIVAVFVGGIWLAIRIDQPQPPNTTGRA